MRSGLGAGRDAVENQIVVNTHEDSTEPQS
jgi:hypothetical protein